MFYSYHIVASQDHLIGNQMDWLVEDTAWTTHDLSNYAYEERNTWMIRKAESDGVGETASSGALWALIKHRMSVGDYCLLRRTGKTGLRK